MMVEQTPPRSKPQRDATVDEARLRQQALGSKLRQMFNDVVNEPVPEDFLDILRRGDRKQGDE
jgi:hypothetical protein